MTNGTRMTLINVHKVVESPGDLSPTQNSAGNLGVLIAGEIIFLREEHTSVLSNIKWVSPESTYI